MNFTKHPSFYTSQQGVGLVEVMVALLLLAIAVLGFTAMQMTAVKATDESLLRTRALTVMRGGAEMMRANPAGIATFATTLNGAASSVTVDSATITLGSCIGSSATACTLNQLAARDALAVKNHATQNNMDIKTQTCPGTGSTNTSTATSATSSTAATTATSYATGQARQCLIASWSASTTAAMSSGDSTACADENGIYNRGVKCFIMEAY